MSEAGDLRELALQRFLRLVSANVGGKAATVAEINVILNEILGDDIRVVDVRRLEQMADLIAVSGAVGAGYAHMLAGDDASPQDAIEWIERAAARQVFGHGVGTAAA